jgi:hypothetical protein
MAANPMRGEADLDGHKIVVDFNRLCTLEAQMGRTVPDLIFMMKFGVGFGVKELRTFVRVLSEKEMTEEEAGDLIGRSGMADQDIPAKDRKNGQPESEKVWVAALALRDAFEGFFAEPKEKAENPLRAA